MGRAINHPQPLLIQGGELSSWFPGSRQPTGVDGDFDTDSRQIMFRAGKIHAKCFS